MTWEVSELQIACDKWWGMSPCMSVLGQGTEG